MVQGWPARFEHGHVGVRPAVRSDAARLDALRAKNHAWLGPWDATVPAGSPTPIRTQSHAGRGVTTLAVALVSDHLLTAAGLHRVEIAIRPENAASLRVVEKLGFTEIGLAPRYLHINGDWRDHRIFQVLAEDVPNGVVSRLTASGHPDN